MVIASADHAAVTQNRNCSHRVFMVAEFHRGHTGGARVPQKHPAVIASANHPPVGEHRHRSGRPAVAGRNGNAAQCGIPGTHPLVVPAADHPPVGQGIQGPNNVIMAAEPNGSSTPRSEVPYPYPVLASADYTTIREDLNC
jgi:hypothetical protein